MKGHTGHKGDQVGQISFRFVSFWGFCETCHDSSFVVQGPVGPTGPKGSQVRPGFSQMPVQKSFLVRCSRVIVLNQGDTGLAGDPGVKGDQVFDCR